jgi:hypothetical protein
MIAIFLIAAGYGWAGGHFIPSGSPFVAYLFQGVILLILLILNLGFFTQQSLPYARWALRGITIFAILTLLINIANIIQGFTNAGSNTFGSHNTSGDLVPICIILTGDILWLGSFLGKKLVD